MNKKQKNLLYRIIAAIVCVIALLLLDSVIPTWYLKLALYMVPYLIVGYDILLKAVKGIQKKQVFDENFLMAVATVGSIFLKEYQEANRAAQGRGFMFCPVFCYALLLW